MIPLLLLYLYWPPILAGLLLYYCGSRLWPFALALVLWQGWRHRSPNRGRSKP